MDTLFNKGVVLLADATGTVQNGLNQVCSGGACNKSLSLQNVFANIADTLIFVVGAVSVIMIILGGLRYVISNGDQKQITAAKDTILYAVIGLIVSIASYAIAHFVIHSIG
jgi:hypothetical protein